MRHWTGSSLAPGNPTLWHGVPVTSIQKYFGSSGRDLKSMKKSPIPWKFCTYRLITYPSTRCDKVRIDPLMATIRNPYFFFFPVANAAWFVVVRPCQLNTDLLSGPKGNWQDRSQAQFLRNWPVRARSLLAQVMACDLTAPSHYLNQCWLIVNCTLMNKRQWNSNQNTKLFIHKNAYKYVQGGMS